MTDKIKRPIRKGAAKVPVVMQLETLECGAACLCMILAYYGKWILTLNMEKHDDLIWVTHTPPLSTGFCNLILLQN